MNILIVGDSFASDYSQYFDIEYPGWPNLLAQKYKVTNLAQAGVGQYKVLKQLESVDFKSFDKIIVSVSSPYRVHCKSHPIHGPGLHENSDLIHTDIDRFSLFKPKLTTAKSWFKYYFDQEYQEDIYDILTDRIREHLKDTDYMLIGHTATRSKHEDIISFEEMWHQNRGVVNHYTAQGNQYIFEYLDKFLVKNN